MAVIQNHIMRIFLFILTTVLLSNCSTTEIKNAKDGFTHRSEKVSSEHSQLIFDKIKIFPNRTELSLAIINNDSITFFWNQKIE